MNSHELGLALSRETGVSKIKSHQLVKILFTIIQEELQERGYVCVTNFGSFNVKERAEKKGRNLFTGQPVSCPKTNMVKFKISKKLKQKLNKKG